MRLPLRPGQHRNFLQQLEERGYPLLAAHAAGAVCRRAFPPAARVAHGAFAAVSTSVKLGDCERIDPEDEKNCREMPKSSTRMTSKPTTAVRGGGSLEEYAGNPKNTWALRGQYLLTRCIMKQNSNENPSAPFRVGLQGATEWVEETWDRCGCSVHYRTTTDGYERMSRRAAGGRHDETRRGRL